MRVSCVGVVLHKPREVHMPKRLATGNLARWMRASEGICLLIPADQVSEYLSTKAALRTTSGPSGSCGWKRRRAGAGKFGRRNCFQKPLCSAVLLFRFQISAAFQGGSFPVENLAVSCF